MNIRNRVRPVTMPGHVWEEVDAMAELYRTTYEAVLMQSFLEAYKRGK
jgi:hypothetical protein